eukprot:TRINITY_DN95171_c0_g1_i1.p1 TRINITY_DN95171_c0_g1~~TRINITY_DN95171_c0_g1_i1.p1  ORF type:complete len:137 (-),score=30.74 TRINITY_DN95171_c0_g1_i1:1286-1696(-)
MELLERIKRIIKLFHETLIADGFIINCDKGKTEFTATLHGKGDAQARLHTIWLDGITVEQNKVLKRSDAYKQLGTWQAFKSRQQKIAKQAADDMMTAAAKLSKHVVGNPHIADKHRHFLCSIILSKALRICMLYMA